MADEPKAQVTNRAQRRQAERTQQPQSESGELHKLRQENRRVMEMLGRASHHIDQMDGQVNMMSRNLMAIVLKTGNNFVLEVSDVEKIVDESVLSVPPLSGGKKGWTYIVKIPPPPMTNEQLKAKLAEAPAPQTPAEAKPQ